MCSSHLIRHSVEPFLDKLITENERWILYENIKREKIVLCKPRTSSATVPKPSIHRRKVLLCLWWDRKGPVYYELLKQGKTINVDLYCNELDKLNAAIKEKRPALASRKGIVFHHNNARPHTAIVTQQKLNALGWEVLGHPLYSPDIAPSDYYPFRSLQNYLTGEKFKSFEIVSKAVADYFNFKDENFYKNSINLKYEAISVPQGSVRPVKKTQERKSSTCDLLITKGVTSSSPVPLKTRRVAQTLANVPDNARCDGYDSEQHRRDYFSNDICTLRNGCRRK
ncbi:histone-lysine N-methyltransferase SETMAR [Trichonephila clavipes]|nr:histone-lysine N-methyltransferase SETMAR [Trichonephila clavipes]